MSVRTKHVSLTRRLLLSTLSLCLLISLGVSLAEVQSRQNWEREQIEKSFIGFSAGPLQEVSEAVWNYNWKMVETIVDSQTSQLFTYMEICDSGAKECVQKGEKTRSSFLDFQTSVHYQTTTQEEPLAIGQVYVQAAYNDYQTILRSEFLKIFSVNSIGIFGLATIIFLLFHQVAVRRVVNVGNYTRAIDLTQVDRLPPLVAHKRAYRADEIDLLADAVDGLVGRIRDEFSRRQQLEKQLTQSQKMEALGTLAGGIAHDFNNILAAILGYAQLCLTGVEPGSKMHSRLEQIVSAGQRAKALISQILIFSRHSEANQEKVQLAEVVSEALTLIRASLPAHIQIRTELDESIWCLGDTTQLHQVVMNLASNAGYVMADHGGELQVSLARQVVDGNLGQRLSLEPGDYACLEIEDAGPGVSATIRDRIFEPFFTTKKAGQGTGMGLAVVHGIVKSHQGAICLDSDPGEGARFRIYLPETTAADATPAAETYQPVGGREHILLVDDEPAVIDMGRGLLEELGYQVTASDNPLQAVDLLQGGHGFDLLITDLTMPEMSGTELAKRVWEKNPRLPIILWTGFADNLSENSLKVAGVREVLYKPFTIKDLDTSVRRVLASASGQRA